MKVRSVFVSTGDTNHIFFYYYLCVYVCVCVYPTGEMKKRSHIPRNSFQETPQNKEQYREPGFNSEKCS